MSYCGHYRGTSGAWPCTVLGEGNDEMSRNPPGVGKVRRSLRVLQRRLAFLEKRISGQGEPMSYDVQEAAALRHAIHLLEEEGEYLAEEADE
jgi:hypothetical protein